MSASAYCGSFATFLVGGETFALPVEEVDEVLLEQPLSPVPLAPPHVLGLLNLRGKILPALDLRQRLEMPPRTPGARRKLLVLRGRDETHAVVVDEIADVLELPPARWAPPPETLPKRLRRYVVAICATETTVLLALRSEAICGGEEDQ